MTNSAYTKAREEQQDPRIGSGITRNHWFACAAHGCPNRWSVHREGWRPMCSAHAWADPQLWPRITQEQIEWVEQHRRWGEPVPAPVAPPGRKLRTEPPASTSRAYRDLHGVDDIEPERE